MGFTFDSPFRIVPGQDSQHVANRKAVKNRLDGTASAKRASTSFLTKLKRTVSKSRPKSSSAASLQPQQTTPPSVFPILSLPLHIREQIYGYSIGKNQTLHILQKQRPSWKPAATGYRRCRANEVESCLSGKCRQLRIMDDQYYGWFDGGIGLLLACKQM